MPESKTSTDAGTEGNPPSPYADRGERPSRLNPILLLWGAVVLTCVLVLLPILHSYNLYDVSRETWGRDVEIEKLRGTIVRLDEALAMSACMAAATGEDERWQRRYRDLEAQLDIAVKDVARLAPDRGDIAETSLPLAFNRKARETEKRALALVRQGRGKDALEILATTAYETERGITFQYEIPRTAQSRRRALRLQELCGAIMHLDEVLTMSARIAAATGDNRWEIRYRTAEPQLHAAIKGAARLMPDVLGVEAAEKTDEANRKLVKLENRAFALIREGRQEEAESLLCSNEYETQKEIYAEGTAEFADLISVGVSRFVAQAQRSVIEHIVEAIFVVILILVIWSFMLAMLNKWQKAMKEKNTQLAQRGQDLEDLNESLDSKVHERTWALKESQSATLNMLADVELTREGLVRANKTLRLEISSREEAQKALQEEKLFADSIIQTAQTIVLVLNTEGRIVRFNAYMENLSGYRLDEVKGKDWFETFLPKRDRARIRVLFMNAINDIQTTGKANPIVTKAGSPCLARSTSPAANFSGASTGHPFCCIHSSEKILVK